MNFVVDDAFYLETYPDIARARVQPLVHFRTFGIKEGRYPNAAFAAQCQTCLTRSQEQGPLQLTGRQYADVYHTVAQFLEQFPHISANEFYETYGWRMGHHSKLASTPLVPESKLPLVFVGHEASRTGAPVFLWNLLQCLKPVAEVWACFFAEPGPLVQVCQEMHIPAHARLPDERRYFQEHRYKEIHRDDPRNCRALTLHPFHTDRIAAFKNQSIVWPGMLFSQLDLYIAQHGGRKPIVVLNTALLLPLAQELRNRGIASVLCIHESNPEDCNHATGLSLVTCNERLMSPSAVIFGSKATQELYLRLFDQLKNRPNAQVIYATVESNIPRNMCTGIAHNAEKLALRKQLRLPADRFIIVLNGTIQVRKRQVEFFTEVFKLLADSPSYSKAFLVYIGSEGFDQSYNQALNRAIASYTPNFVLKTGELPISTVIQYVRSSDVVVCNSTTECFPLSVLEAMVCGVPVVARKCFGTVEQIQSGSTGYLIDLPAQMLTTLRKLYDDPLGSEVQAIRVNAQKFVRSSFFHEPIRKQWLALFQQIKLAGQ